MVVRPLSLSHDRSDHGPGAASSHVAPGVGDRALADAGVRREGDHVAAGGTLPAAGEVLGADAAVGRVRPEAAV